MWLFYESAPDPAAIYAQAGHMVPPLQVDAAESPTSPAVNPLLPDGLLAREPPAVRLSNFSGLWMHRAAGCDEGLLAGLRALRAELEELSDRVAEKERERGGRREG